MPSASITAPVLVSVFARGGCKARQGGLLVVRVSGVHQHPIRCEPGCHNSCACAPPPPTGRLCVEVSLRPCPCNMPAVALSPSLSLPLPDVPLPVALPQPHATSSMTTRAALQTHPHLVGHIHDKRLSLLERVPRGLVSGGWVVFAWCCRVWTSVIVCRCLRGP